MDVYSLRASSLIKYLSVHFFIFDKNPRCVEETLRLLLQLNNWMLLLLCEFRIWLYTFELSRFFLRFLLLFLRLRVRYFGFVFSYPPQFRLFKHNNEKVVTVCCCCCWESPVLRFSYQKYKKKKKQQNGWGWGGWWMNALENPFGFFFCAATQTRL